MGSNRQCSKTSCQAPAVATLTYNYADSTVVLGPLSRLAEPHTYDLCRRHAQSMTAPKGWDLLRLELPQGEYRSPEPDDLLAVAHAVQSPLQSRTHGQSRTRGHEQGTGTDPHSPSGRVGRHSRPTPSVDRSVRSPQDAEAGHSEETTSQPAPRSERPEPLGVDGPARPGRPVLRLLKDPEA